MTIIPIFIYRERKTDEELRAERERDERFRKAVEEDERRRRERDARIRWEKEQKRREEQEMADAQYRVAMKENWLDYQILPEGWSIFGQTNMGIVREI